MAEDDDLRIITVEYNCGFSISYPHVFAGTREEALLFVELEAAADQAHDAHHQLPFQVGDQVELAPQFRVQNNRFIGIVDVINTSARYPFHVTWKDLQQGSGWWAADALILVSNQRKGSDNT